MTTRRQEDHRASRKPPRAEPEVASVTTPTDAMRSGATRTAATDREEELCARAFVRFYSPLAVTSVLLTSTTILLAMALARSAEPTAALAGYSIAFALTGLLYSPLLAIQQFTAARIVQGAPFHDVHRFALLIGALLSGLGATVAFTPAGALIFKGVIGVAPDAYDQAVGAMQFLWPVPLLTAFRAAHQGVLVATRRTRAIAIASAMRTLVLAASAFGLVLLTGAGAWAAGLAFVAGLAAESALVGALSRSRWPASPEARGNDQGLFRFSGPLMMSTVLWWGMPLIINAALARTPGGTGTLAAFGALEAIAWFVTAPVGQLQHASLTLVTGPESHRRVRSWTRILSLAVATLLLLLALPPAHSVVLQGVLGLDHNLAAAVGAALPLTAAYPVLYGTRGYYSGLLVRAGFPGRVGRAALWRTVALLSLAALGVALFGHLGVLLGAGLAVTGLTCRKRLPLVARSASRACE